MVLLSSWVVPVIHVKSCTRLQIYAKNSKRGPFWSPWLDLYKAISTNGGFFKNLKEIRHGDHALFLSTFMITEFYLIYISNNHDKFYNLNSIMSQYGKAEYWEDRYTRYLFSNQETHNLSIGINDLVDWRISSQLISIELTKF